ncbi:MAG: transposase [Acidobacteria bacterium]|nr:transposase [Acidobacteriota bacterium]
MRNFTRFTPRSLQLAMLNRELQNWERVYNTVRPDQTLNYQTPSQFIASWRDRSKT